MTDSSGAGEAPASYPGTGNAPADTLGTGNAPAAAPVPGAEDTTTVKWAFVLQIVGILVGFPTLLITPWMISTCTNECRTLNSAGLGTAMILTPLVVPVLCLIASALVCRPGITERRNTAVWAITWTGFTLVLLTFFLVAS